MLLLGGVLFLGFAGVLLLAIYAKTITDENRRLRATFSCAGQLLDCILDPKEVPEYQKDPALMGRDTVVLLAALKDPDGKAAADLRNIG